MSALAKAHDRGFGVEIECGHDRGEGYIRQAMSRTGFDLGGNYTQGGYSVGYDGSGVEVRTPILRGKEGFRELKRVFKFLNDEGCYITIRDGMHVHHDAPELKTTPALCLKLVQSFMENRAPIVEMVAPRRRNIGPYANWTIANQRTLEAWVRENTEQPNPFYRPNSRFPNERVPVMAATQNMPTFGRCDLNTDAIREHGSVEWRLHEGCLNYDHAVAWIMFAQKFMHRVIYGKTPVRARTRADLIRQIRLTKKEREAIEAKIAANAFPPAGARFVNGR